MRITTLALAVAAFVVGFATVGALAHTASQYGGPGADTLNGHEHTDYQYGRGGCDDLLGRGGSDAGYGGDSGCDTVRGMDDGGDWVVVCDDGAGNDEAYGGAGQVDWCLGSAQDYFSDPSCEVAVLQPTNC